VHCFKHIGQDKKFLIAIQCLCQSLKQLLGAGFGRLFKGKFQQAVVFANQAFKPIHVIGGD